MKDWKDKQEQKTPDANACPNNNPRKTIASGPCSLSMFTIIGLVAESASDGSITSHTVKLLSQAGSYLGENVLRCYVVLIH